MHLLDEMQAAQVSAAGQVGWVVGKAIGVGLIAYTCANGNPVPLICDVGTGFRISNTAGDIGSEIEDWIWSWF